MIFLPKPLPLTSSPPTEVTLSLGHNLFTTIDYDDFSSFHKYHWKARKSHSCWYASRKETVQGKSRTVFLHRELLNAKPDEVVHHLNRNTLDNRRANLQLLTPHDHGHIHAFQRLCSPCGPFSP